MEQGQNLTLWVAFGAGLLSFLSPCVLPLIPSYVSFITGLSLRDLSASQKNTEMMKKMILNSVLFILGFSTVFVSLGASASFLGQVLSEYKFTIMRVGGVLIILLGLFITGLLKIAPLTQEKKVHLTRKPLGLIGSFLVGITFAAGWTPCVGPILGSVLVIAGSTGQLLRGILLLSIYSLGLAIPFFLSTLAIGWFLSFNKKIQKYINIISILAGILLIIVGVLMVTGKFTWLSYVLNY